MTHVNNYFSGELRGYNVNGLHSCIDYDVRDVDGRLKIAEDMVNTGFFEEYFDNHFDANYNKNSPLSEDNNVCRLLDRVGTYILMSDEEIERRKAMDSPAYSTGYLVNRINMDASLESIATDTELSSAIIHNIKSSDVPKIAKNKTIHIKNLTKQNLDSIIEYVGIDDQEEIDILHSYMRFYNRLNNSSKSKKLIDRTKMNIRKDIETVLNRHLPCVRHNNLEYNNSSSYEDESVDMSYKHKLLGVSFYNTQGALEYEPGYLFYNKECGLNVNDELELRLYELDKVIKKSELTKRELSVLKLLRNGVSMGDIAKKLNISTRTATRDKQKIVNKVLETSRGLNKEV